MIKFFTKKKNENSQTNKELDGTKQNELENQLENKWWHRLIKVFIWFISCGVLLYFLSIALEEEAYVSTTTYEIVLSIIGILSFSFFAFFAALFLLKLFYCKIIIYIIYGKKIRLAKKAFLKKMLFVIISLVLLFIISVFLLRLSEKNSNKENIEAGKNDSVGISNDPEYKIELLEAKNLGSSIKCGNREFLCEDQNTNGKFIKVVFQINNITSETIKGGRLWIAKLPWNSSKIIDSQNREYESYTAVSIPNFGESECNPSELKPNLPKRCIKIYEVSTDSEGLKIEMEGYPAIELGI